MGFLLDLQVLQSASQARGIGRYSRGLAGALLSGFGGDASVLLNLSLGDRKDYCRNQQWAKERVRAGAVHAFRGLTQTSGRNPTNEANRRASALCYDAYVATRGVDIVHIASPFEGFTDDTIAGWGDIPGPARAATLYDLIPFQQPDVHLDNFVRAVWYDQRLQELVRSDVLLAISDATRTVALDMLGVAADRVVNIGADCDPIFQKLDLPPRQRDDVLMRYRITKPFIIHVGAAEPRKNVGMLIRAFGALSPELKNGHQLLLAGEMTDLQRKEIAGEIRKSHLDPLSVILPGFVPDEDLIPLYACTRAAVMPSHLEGFGLPLLEAMRCGAPVLGADCSSLPEVVGSKELLFKPRAESLAEKLNLILADSEFRTRALAHCDAQQRLFSWRRTAALTHEAFAAAVARRNSEKRARNDGRTRYVLVPPREYAVDSLRGTVAELQRSGDVVIARPCDAPAHSATVGQAPVVDAAAIGVSGNQRVVIAGDLNGLDEIQQAVLATTPAVLLPLQGARASVAMPDLKYWRGGYCALCLGGNDAVTDGRNRDGWYPNLIGKLGGGANLADQIETAHRAHPLGIVPSLLDRLRLFEGLDSVEVAIAIAENQSGPMAPRLLVDLSSLVRHDAGSGIQRVVRAILANVLTAPHEWRVEPIYRDGNIYRYARKFTCGFLKVDPGNLSDGVVDFHESDTFLGLDLDAELPEPAANVLRYHRQRGMRVIFIVYDLLPILRGNWFEPYMSQVMTLWLHRIVSFADQMIAISRSVANDIDTFVDHLPKKPSQRPVVSWWHLGSDFMVTAATAKAFKTLEDKDAAMLEELGGRTVFLTVGTIEPRKGIGHLLDAADEFWRTNDATFVIVGKKGWMVDRLVERIKAHPEFGKRLIWFDHPTDAVLQRLYGLATAALLPSEGEGFGLPLIEAAKHKTPIIARDIPVFREVGGDGVYYFTAKSGAEFSAALCDWLGLHQRGEAPKPEMKIATWYESTENLLGVIRANAKARETAVSRHTQ